MLVPLNFVYSRVGWTQSARLLGLYKSQNSLGEDDTYSVQGVVVHARNEASSPSTGKDTVTAAR